MAVINCFVGKAGRDRDQMFEHVLFSTMKNFPMKIGKCSI